MMIDASGVIVFAVIAGFFVIGVATVVRRVLKWFGM
jgi:hypothetical protein